jgi:hypothetical protein
MITDDVKLIDKVKAFLKLNSYLVWICFLVLCAVNIITMNDVKSDIEETNKKIIKNYEEMKGLVEKEIQGVVILTENGSVLNAAKSYIDASTQSDYNLAIKNALISHLVFSNNELTQNFTRQLSTTEDILKYQPLKEFQDNFLLPDNKKTMDSWNYLISNIANLSREQKMADSISVLDSVISSYSWDTKNQSFQITINVVAKAFFWNDIIKAYDEAQGYYTINADGVISIKENTILNPLGIRFSNIALTIPTKNN